MPRQFGLHNFSNESSPTTKKTVTARNDKFANEVAREARDGGVRQELAAGVLLRSGGSSAFGGKAKEAMSRVTDGGETAIEQFRTQLGAAIDSVDPVKRALDTRL